MKKEMTREEVAALANCNGFNCPDCKTCQAIKICDSTSEAICKWLAEQLLEEMDKPKVWDGAPEDTKTAEVCFFNNLYCDSGRADMVYTREIPKTRARKNAEELYKILCFQRTGKTDCINAIESALEKYAAELKGKERASEKTCEKNKLGL